jgi:NADPH:quinone reductase-like Zn-dependent oxidoreductase
LFCINRIYTYTILGFDAVGTVQKTGTEVTMFKEGDIVFYSGAPNQHGSNQPFILIWIL